MSSKRCLRINTKFNSWPKSQGSSVDESENNNHLSQQPKHLQMSLESNFLDLTFFKSKLCLYLNFCNLESNCPVESKVSAAFLAVSWAAACPLE